ncbi:MAG: AAC(3) family N-acetyltransferase [Planctomycetes bacterium]|nr:AAC(3) family N-acetyltransferase [Planctomycetota bacterium]
MKVTQAKIEEDLRALGLKKGDIVILHSALSSIGRVEGGGEAVVDAFLSVLGEAGTLVAPIFGKLGVLTEIVRDRSNAVASVHPMAAVAAIGAKAEEICADHWKAETAHGDDTPYLKIADLGGYVCLLGVDQDRCTTLHAAEELLRLPYLRTTTERTFQTPEGEKTKSWAFFPGPHRDFMRLDHIFRESGKMRIGKVGNAVTRLMKSRDMIDLAIEAMRADGQYVLCDNPNCADCVRQRAAARRDLFAREDFRIVASAALAGRYADEIVDNCKAAGIDAVELDYVMGRPVPVTKGVKIAPFVERLREGGIEVTALRTCIVSHDVAGLLAAAAECEVPRVVMPLTAEGPAHAALAAAADVEISFYNANLNCRKVLEFMTAARQADPAAGLTFNVANFARCGEQPFTSYRKKLARFIDQLDVEDCTYEGTPTALAMGNGEIKEVISMLRCRSFAGTMVMGAGNRSAADLVQTTKRFVELIEAM